MDLVLLMQKLLLIATAIFMVNCSARWGEPIVVDFEFRDIPTEQRIELSFTNNLDRAVCMSEEDWPNAAGKMGFASDSVFLIVEGVRFPIVEFNTGVCVPRSRCYLRVKPQEQLSGSIPYIDFLLPEEYWEGPKELDFSPLAYEC